MPATMIPAPAVEALSEVIRRNWTRDDRIRRQKIAQEKLQQLHQMLMAPADNDAKAAAGS